MSLFQSEILRSLEASTLQFFSIRFHLEHLRDPLRWNWWRKLNDVNNVNYTLPMETASHRIKLTPYRLGLSPAMRMHTKFLLSHTRSRWHLYSIKSSLKTWRFTRITMSYINPPTPLWRWRRAYCGATATLNAQWHLSIQQSLYQL